LQQNRNYGLTKIVEIENDACTQAAKVKFKKKMPLMLTCSKYALMGRAF